MDKRVIEMQNYEFNFGEVGVQIKFNNSLEQYEKNTIIRNIKQRFKQVEYDYNLIRLNSGIQSKYKPTINDIQN